MHERNGKTHTSKSSMEMGLRYIRDTLAFISQNGYETDYNKFLKSTAVFLSKTFNVNYVLIDKYSLKNPTVTEAVVMYSMEKFLPNFTYKLQNTPCQNVINKKTCYYPINVKAIFPKDDFLAQKNIDSYIGIPLWSSEKEPIGLIALMDDKPIKDWKTIETVLGIISIKVEEVLEKMSFENQLNLKVEELISLKELAEKNEEKFKKLANLIFEGILISENGIALECNKVFLKMFGYSSKEIIGKKTINILFPEKYHKKITENRLKKHILPYEVEGIRKDGTVFPIEIQARNVEYMNTKNGRLISFKDISSRKREEIESRKRITAIEQSANTIVITDTYGNIEYTNPKFTEITGYTAAEALGKNPRILNSGEHPKEFYKHLWQTISAGNIWSGQMKNKTKSGKFYWEQVTITPIKAETGEILSYLAIKEDITERKRAEENLKESEKKYRFLFDNNPQPMWIYDLETLAFLEVNNATIQHYGYTREEFLSMNLKDIRPKEDIDALLKDIEMAKRVTHNALGEWLHITKNGKIINVSIVAHNVTFNNRKARHVLVNDITASKKAEQELLTANIEIEKSEKKFRELFEKSGDAILIIKNGYFVDCNQATLDMLGYENFEDVLNSHPSKLSPKLQPDGSTSFEKAEELIKISLEKGTHRFEWWHTKSNGETFPVEVLLTTIENELNNKVIHCVWRDITDRKKAEEQLQKQNEEYRVLSEDYLNQNSALIQLSNELSEKNRLLLESKDRFINLFEQNPVPLWEQDFSKVIKLLNEKKAETKDLKIYLDNNPDFVSACISNIKILHVNIAALKLFGVKNTEELKIHLGKSNNKKALEVLKRELVSIVSNNKTFSDETELTRKDGSPIFALIKSVIIDDYGTSIASVIDFTAERNATNELQKAKEIAEKNENKLNEAQKIANMGSYELDFSTGIWKSSPVLDNIFGIGELSDRDVKGWLGIVHQEDLEMMEQYFEKNIIENRESFNKEYRITRKSDKQTRWVHGMGKLEFDNQGNLKSMIGTIQDISEKRKILEDLINAKEKAEESNKLKTEFIQNMSHEIRTPMNGILGFSELLDNRDLSEEKRKNFIEIIKNSTNQLLHIIDDLMEISVLEAKQIKVEDNPVCINDLLHELFAVFNIKAKKNKTSLILKNGLSNQESTILTDKNKLTKVLSNLLENALKFTNKGTVELGYKLNKDIEPAELEIFVKDSGIGIEPEKQELIFERFSQAEKELSKKVGGLGLGLSIAKENAELLGGKISVLSKLGNGATFLVTIPYKPVYLIPKIEKQQEKISEKKEKYTILIAEDEDVNFMVIEILLEEKLKLPCTIFQAINGLEAVELCEKNPEIELVLMDIKMPKMDGHEATRKIKEFRPNLPIIAQTAYSSPEEKEKAFLAGCNDFISKPISKEKLSTIINKYLLAGNSNGNASSN